MPLENETVDQIDQKTTTKTITWTDEERRAVYTQYNLMYPNEIPTDRMVRIAAERVLPPERRRNHISPDDPVKQMIYKYLGRPFPFKNQRKATKAKRISRKRNRENLISAEGERAYAKHATNNQQSIATLQSSKPLLIRIVLELGLNAAATIVRE